MLSLAEVYRLAAIGTRAELARALRGHPSGAVAAILRGTLAQYDGDVDGASAQLARAARSVRGADAALVADLRTPILIMRHRKADLDNCARIMAAHGWRACAEVLRAIVAVDGGRHEAARRCAAKARAALHDVADDIVRARVLQRLARVAYLLGDHAEAVDDALASAQLCIAVGAWRAAAAGYSIVYNVHHNVSGEIGEADRYAQLWRAAATLSGDISFEQSAVVAEYEMAVQVGDAERVRVLEGLVKRRSLPEQYVERFPYSVAYAQARGFTEPRTMRTVLQVLSTVPDLTPPRAALCGALIALSYAAEFDDEAARQYAHGAISSLRRPRSSDAAYEQRYRRMARGVAAAVCHLIGDDVRASRIVSTRESRCGDGENTLVDLLRTGRLHKDPPRPIRGLAMLVARAADLRNALAAQSALTPAQLEVLTLLGQGWSAQRIAEQTGRSRNTVYNHTRAILDRLEARRAPEAVAIARARGILV